MSGSGKGLLGLWLYRSGEKEWALKEGSPIHHSKSVVDPEKVLPPLGRSNKVDKNNVELSISVPSGPVDRTSIMFTLKNQVGCLARALQVFQELGINVLHLDLQNTDPNKVDCWQLSRYSQSVANRCLFATFAGGCPCGH